MKPYLRTYLKTARTNLEHAYGWSYDDRRDEIEAILKKIDELILDNENRTDD